MLTVTYNSLRADHAWSIASQNLQRRNDFLSAGIRFLEKHPVDHKLASRLVILQYHLRSTVRDLVQETSSMKPAKSQAQQVQRQWMVVHQLHYLLKQIDDQLLQCGRQSSDFRQWREKRIMSRRTTPLKATSIYMN
ncbi:hypothetical protein [Tellurirhabdus bombi]|uniref:hypothetical protein n=1 Tax=Tellurirhabdus bombi TaxID=2907205 RepID=UPI001F3217C1|nr:hypothetical protein [Tellurirhabdus bombi]